MPQQKPAAANMRKAPKTHEKRRKVWRVAAAALLVAGILYVPPFTPDKHLDDGTDGRPDVVAQDQPQQGTAQTGSVLAQHDTNKPASTNRERSNAGYPDTNQPVPTPQPVPTMPPLPVLPLPAAVLPPQQPLPVVPPVTEPQVLPVDVPQPQPEPLVCDTPQLAVGETQLANNAAVSFDSTSQTTQAVYVLSTTDHCPAVWEPLQHDGTILWADDGVDRPISVIMDSEQNPETGMHHGSNVRFRFKLSETTPPAQDQQFSFAVRTAASTEPVTYTITATVNTVVDEPETDHATPPAETQL